MPALMTYWTLSRPQKWQAGTVGADKTPIYFSCADCGEKDAAIAGIVSTDGTFRGIGVVRTEGSAFVNPAMFCTKCFAKRQQKAVARD